MISAASGIFSPEQATTRNWQTETGSFSFADLEWVARFADSRGLVRGKEFAAVSNSGYNRGSDAASSLHWTLGVASGSEPTARSDEPTARRERSTFFF
jgi:hypothetical protein